MHVCFHADLALSRLGQGWVRTWLGLGWARAADGPMETHTMNTQYKLQVHEFQQITSQISRHSNQLTLIGLYFFLLAWLRSS